MTEPRLPLLGIDWGTSNRRAYLLDERGEVVRTHADDEGILKVNGNFTASLRALLQVLGLSRADVILSGMVGSRNGWHEVPYLSVDQSLSRLHEALHEIRTEIPEVRCRIVPGYQFRDAHGLPDVMRGEETQLLGGLRLSDTTGWFILPGTHSKWARIENGRMMEFFTFMTGELFALLSQHGTLSKVMHDQQTVPSAFEAGLDAARHGSFTHTAFCCRALVVTNAMPAEHTASYLSGLLIGAELQDMLQRAGGQFASPVQIIGTPSLAARYRNALEWLGVVARVWDPDQVYVAALRALFDIKR